MMAEFHFLRFCTGSQRHDLMTKTDTESRNALFNQVTSCFNRIGTRLWIARTIRQEDTVRRQFHDVCCRRLGRQHCHFAATIRQHAQDIAFDAKIESDDVIFRITQLFITCTEFPSGFRPLVGLIRRDLFGKILTGKT